MKNAENTSLDSVTKDEVIEVKHSIKEWARQKMVVANLEKNINSLNEQLNILETARTSESLSPEAAEMTKEIIEMRIKSLKEVMAGVISNAVDAGLFISTLEVEERSLICGKYIECMNTVQLCNKLHVSRATLFRIQDRAFKKIALMKREKKVTMGVH
ncbi:MAG: DUF1492 domain-containing protein [Anaerotignum sp.]|nr:DUF1492 domain-containing protein [Anaerotignum sp.]MBR5121920.1 DUF1492 domain-containing protein [Anaerotignum sp.]